MKRYLYVGIGFMTVGLLLLSCIRCSAQELPKRSPLSATLHDPALWLNIGGHGLAIGTTTAFLSGYGTSRDHEGPCVEGNSHWGSPHPALGPLWRSAVLGAAVGAGAVYLSHLPGMPKWARVTFQATAYAGGTVALIDGAHNVWHCGLY